MKMETSKIMAFVPLTIPSLASRPSPQVTLTNSLSRFKSSFIVHPLRIHPPGITPIPTLVCSVVGEDKDSKQTQEESSSSSIGNQEYVPAPGSFYQAVQQAQAAVKAAFKANERLIEVEFPPLSTEALESSSLSAYEVFDANLKLAVDFARGFTAGVEGVNLRQDMTEGDMKKRGWKVAIAVPDEIEKKRAVELCGGKEEPITNIRLTALNDEYSKGFLERIWVTDKKQVAVKTDDDMFIVIGASCQELPDVKSLVERAEGRPVVLFNLKLDTARGDLGLPAFPSKDIHYHFLSRFIPVYYLRQRQYSRSIPRPPYVVNYSGALFRAYPGPYQVLLDIGQGKTRRVQVYSERPALGQVRDALTDALQLDDVPKDDKMSGLFSFLRKGYKSTTWWEENLGKQSSNKWRE